MYQLEAEASFDSAHFLSEYHGKCENLHGHRWRVVATIYAEELIASGDEREMVCDFSNFKHALKDIVKQYDHTFLVEDGSLSEKTISCLKDEGFTLTILPFRTTAENLAKDIFSKLEAYGFNVLSVEVDETPNNRSCYLKGSPWHE